MAKVLDVVYKSVNVALGVATVVFGANLAVNIYRGFSWHYSQKAAEEAQRKEIP